MEPVDLTKDDNYMRRVYGKALYHAQRRTVEKAKPDSLTRPLHYKKASGLLESLFAAPKWSQVQM